MKFDSFARGLSILVIAAATTTQAQVRYEAEALGTPRNLNDIAGYDSINGVVGRAADVTASNGEILFTAGPARNFKFIFKGTGVSLIGREDADGVGFNWILNGGTTAETTGSGTMVGPSRVDQKAFVIAPAGTLPNRLHTLEIRHNGSPGVLRVDALDVFDDSRPTYVDQNNPGLTYSAGDWTPGETGADSAAEAFGGSTTWTVNANASLTVPFNGTGIAALVMTRGDARTINWDIDGTRTGNWNIAAQNALSFGFWHRWPLLFANDLAPGNHTLTITADSSVAVTNVFIDAIVIDGALGHVASVEEWTLFE